MNISIEEMPREIDRLLEENERLEEQLKRYKRREFISKPENINITETLLDIKDSMYLKLSLYSNELEDRIDEKDKEIERLNNIINELEKWIEKNKQFQVISERCIVWEDKLIDKLQELKGSENSE